MGKNKNVVCPVCGEQNRVGAKFCSECGAELKIQKSPNSSSTKSKPKLGNNSAPEKIKNSGGGNKIFPVYKILMLLIGLLLVGGVMLLLSGQLDRPKVNTKTNNNTSQNQKVQEQHQGADLSVLNEIKQLEDIYNKNPNNLDALLKLAHKLNDSKFYNKAITYYNKYLKKRKKDADVWVDMGVCYFELRDYNTAINSMKKAIKINPNHQIAHFNLGIVNYAAGKPLVAREWWQKAVKIDPTTRIAKKAKELLEKNN